jgi:uncharacterized protein (TIGR03000 family)
MKIQNFFAWAAMTGLAWGVTAQKSLGQLFRRDAAWTVRGSLWHGKPYFAFPYGYWSPAGNNWGYTVYDQSYYGTPGYANARPNYVYQPLGIQKAATVPANNQSNIRVKLPSAEARLWFQNQPTNQSGHERIFRSPPLQPGYRYTYEIRAQWQENGQNVSVVRSIRVEPGQEVSVDFTQPIEKQ